MAKKSTKDKFIAIGEYSNCQHDEFSTMEKAAQHQVDSDEADKGTEVTVYKKVGKFKVKTIVTPA